ncbi:MAG: lytic transglycosylase domain-containing protein [Deltaproteobacteria bacterium]|nr:lytic transglycosylase domain-containing protein [Deltaproteobacteria bacterium]
MEKRHTNALARTLRWLSSFFAKLSLVALLFLPAWLSAQYLVRAEQTLEPQAETKRFSPLKKVVQFIEKPKPKDLVKIYSIVRSNRPDISDTEAWQVSEVILQESAKHAFDPMLVLAVIEVESRFQYKAISPVGARGIMQIMPDTGKFLSTLDIGRRQGLSAETFRTELLDDPILNIKLGVFYLHDLKRHFRNLNLALIAYNRGPTEIQTRLDNNEQLPDGYANLVMTAYQKYRKAKLPTF